MPGAPVRDGTPGIQESIARFLQLADFSKSTPPIYTSRRDIFDVWKLWTTQPTVPLLLLTTPTTPTTAPTTSTTQPPSSSTTSQPKFDTLSESQAGEYQRFISAIGRVLSTLPHLLPTRKYKGLLAIQSAYVPKVNSYEHIRKGRTVRGGGHRESNEARPRTQVVRESRINVKLELEAELKRNPTPELLHQHGMRHGVTPKFLLHHTVRWSYMDEFVSSLTCAPDLLTMRLFPNAKELSESFAALHAVKDHLANDISLKDPKVTAVFVGDGATPRTAALFAFRSSWKCISIDPILQVKGPWDKVDRLTSHKVRIQDIQVEAEHLAVIILVHAHVSLKDCLRHISAPNIAVVAMPCCGWPAQQAHLPGRGDEAGRGPDIVYEDENVCSPQRFMRLWRPTAHPFL